MALLLGAAPAWAGTITAELDRTEGNIGDSFVLTVSVEGVRDSDPIVPPVQGLVINQQGVSESTVFANGHRTSELQLTYVVYPQQAATFTIPSITAQVDGKSAGTLPLTLKVHPAGGSGNVAQNQQGQPQAQGQAQGQPQAQGQAQSQAPQGTKTAPKGKLEDTGGVFLERECNNLTPYVGEQIICTIRLYHRGNLNGGQRVAQSSAEVRRFNVDGEKRYQRLVNGQPYGVIELKEVVVAAKAGAVELPPYQIDAHVLVYTHKNNPLDKFFDNFGGGVFNFDLNFTEEKNVSVKSEPTQLNVKPLPDAGKPAGFAGLVGTYQLSGNVSKPQVAAGETVTITITLDGVGVSDMMADPAPNLSQLGKVYADKPEYNEQVSGETGIKARRTYKYALVPSKPGQYDLGQIQVGSSRVDLQACKLEYSIVSPK